MTEYTRGESKQIAAAAERQMRRSLLMESIDQRLEHERAAELAKTLGPYIAISRESCAGGSEIARMVGDKLGWEVLDKELMEVMAERYHLPRDLVEFVDEKTANWLHESFVSWLDKQAMTQTAYVDHLGKIVLLTALKGNVVFVGRGAQFFLPRDRGLAVRIVAPDKYRIEQAMQRYTLKRPAAKQFIADTDRGRRELIRNYFNRDIEDPKLYDLVINVEKVGMSGVANLIVEALAQAGELAPAKLNSATATVEAV